QKENENPVMLDFKTEEGIAHLDVRSIYYFEYSERSVMMYTQSGTFRLHQKISALATSMRPYNFSQPHKSFCVNLFHVQSIKGYDIRLTCDAVIPLSQKKSSAFREELNVYLGHLIG
ncbi:MAG: LytTR family DNA-binding domain-containing protein, partial [Eubacterium sp.]